MASTSDPDTKLYAHHCASARRPRFELTPYADGGITEAAFVAAGLAHPLAERWRLFGEIGGVGTLAERYDHFDNTLPRGVYRNEGFYFAAGLTYLSSRERREQDERVAW